MEQIKNLLEARKKYLLQVKKEKEDALTAAPEGYLRLCCHGNRTQYYQRMAPRDYNGVYLRSKDFDVVQALAQKEYDKKVLYAAGKELNAIEKYLSAYPGLTAEQIYEKLHKERQKLVEPIRETEEQYIQNWESVKYQGKDFEEDVPEFYTARGERVRSKSEVIIADLLNRESIPYRYEYPVNLKGTSIVYPDFTLINVRLRKEMYWEHLGMMDDPSYAEKALQKISLYEQNGIFLGEKLILTYETRKTPLNQKQILRKIRHYLK